MNIHPSPRLLCATLTALSLGLVAATSNAQSLLLHYSLDQASGNTTPDSSANPANGTLTGSGNSWTTLPPAFIASHAYSNNGANGTFITAGDAAKLDGLTNFTITGWLKVTSANISPFTQDRIASKRGGSGAFFDLKFDDAGSGAMGMSLEINTTVGSSVTVTSSAMNMDDWFFFAVTRDSTTGAISFYYGTPEGDLTAAGGGIGRAGTILDNVADFMIGNASANTSRAPFASFSDFRIYNDVMDLSAIRSVQAAAIPEPTSLSLAVAGALGGGLLLRRRKMIRS